ncbi:SapC family protein [Alkalimonas sp. NCh-2]|uniref:SapC family protein n=1 Tax=Alkalimonas sp. NCh-2 TaxID=3144846 RepID=UPI0031F70DBA
MTAKIVPLSKEQHQGLRVHFKQPFAHIAEEHLLPVVVHEFGPASAAYPIVFVKNNDSGNFQPVVLLGLEPGKNLYLRDEQMQASYVPMSARNYPFFLTADPENDKQLTIGIDENSPRFATDEGEALFTEQGEESELLQRAKQQLADFFDTSRVTRTFVEKLTALNLLEAKTLTVQINGNKREINGLFLIDEKKLNELSDEQFNELRKQGYLAPIYAQMLSVQQVQHLTRWQSEKEAPAESAATA